MTCPGKKHSPHDGGSHQHPHEAKHDDPGGKREVYYRRAILDFFGNPIFAAPLGTGSADRAISAVDDVVGPPVIAVDDDPTFAGGFAKHVAIGWREIDKAQDRPTLRTRASHDSGNTFLLETVVAHTAAPGVRVESFDLEVLGGRHVATWSDNAFDAGGSTLREELLDGEARRLHLLLLEAVDQRVLRDVGRPDMNVGVDPAGRLLLSRCRKRRTHPGDGDSRGASHKKGAA